MFPNAPQLQLAMFHTAFNLITVLIVLPLTNPLVKLVSKIVPDKKGAPLQDIKPRLYFVEEHMLKNPPVAVQQVKREIINMAEIALNNFNIASEIVCSLDYQKAEEFKENETQLNFLNKELASFIAKLLKSDLSEKDRIYLATAFRSITDLERVGDYAENIIEYADKLKEANQTFSDTAKKEIADLQTLIVSLYNHAINAYTNGDKQSLKNAYEIEEKVDGFTALMAENHIKRLNENLCTPEVGAQYLALSANVERIADHYINVAKTIG